MATRGEQARDDRQSDRPADADRRDQAEGEERPDDRAEVVHRPLEAVGPSVGARPARRRPAGRCGPGPGARGPSRLRRAGSRPATPRSAAPISRRQHGGGRVAADRHRPTAVGIIGERPATEAGHAGQAVGDALDQAQRRRGRTERRREQARQQRRWHLVPDIGEQARRPDPSNTRRQPGRLVRRLLGQGHRVIVADRRHRLSRGQSDDGAAKGP